MGRQDRRAAGPGDLDDRAAVGGLERPRGQHLVGRPEGDLAAVEAEHRVPAARLLEVVGGDRRSPDPPRRARRSVLPALGAGASRPENGSSSSSTPRVLDQRAGDQHALALAAGELAEGLARRGRQADPPSAPRAPLALGAARAAATRGAARAFPSSPRRGPRPGSRAASARSAAPCRSGRHAQRRRRAAAARRAAPATASSCRRRWGRAAPIRSPAAQREGDAVDRRRPPP